MRVTIITLFSLLLVSCADQIEFDSDHDLVGRVFNYDTSYVNAEASELYLIREKMYVYDSITLSMDLHGNPTGLSYYQRSVNDAPFRIHVTNPEKIKHIVFKTSDPETKISGSFKYKDGIWITYNYSWEVD